MDFGEGLIFAQVGLPVCAEGGEFWRVWQPICEVVFGEDGEVGASGGGGGNEVGRFGEVEGGVEGLVVVSKYVPIGGQDLVGWWIESPLDAAG